MNEYLKIYIATSIAFFFGNVFGVNSTAFNESLPFDKHIYTGKDVIILLIFSFLWPIIAVFAVLSIIFGPINRNDK